MVAESSLWRTNPDAEDHPAQGHDPGQRALVLTVEVVATVEANHAPCPNPGLVQSRILNLGQDRNPLQRIDPPALTVVSSLTAAAGA